MFDPIDEGTTARFRATLTDEDGTAITLASISTALLTYYDRDTGAVINSRDAQDVKNANNVTIHATSGLVTWLLQVNDVGLTGTKPAGELEMHVAQFVITVSGGKQITKVYDIPIRSLQKYPAV